MSAPATDDSHASAMFSQVIASPAQLPALPKADENLPLTLLSHPARPEVSFFAATFA
jgi:hypothetical protein